MNKAVVVFLGQKSVDDPAWYARWLKTGFVHCFILVESEGYWIKLEGTNGIVHVSLASPFNDHYRDQWATVIETPVADGPIRCPLVARTCVGLIKSVLGIRAFALTPWQLYKYLESVT